MNSSRTLPRTSEETREYHRRYLFAVNNPVRRSILRTLVGGEATVETIQSKTGIDPQSVIWHLNILEYGSCVEKERKDGTLLYRLTKEGTVVGYVDK